MTRSEPTSAVRGRVGDGGGWDGMVGVGVGGCGEVLEHKQYDCTSRLAGNLRCAPVNLWQTAFRNAVPDGLYWSTKVTG